MSLKLSVDAGQERNGTLSSSLKSGGRNPKGEREQAKPCAKAAMRGTKGLVMLGGVGDPGSRREGGPR